MAWLEGFERVNADKLAGPYVGSPWRLVLHSTEGGSSVGAVAAYRNTGSWPHFTVDPARRQRLQHYDTNTSARAMMHPVGLPETNKANAVQIEIVGFATQMPDMPDDQLAWLANSVVAPIRGVAPFTLTAPLFVPYPSSYGFGAAQRLSWAQWSTFNGICGHQHVPGNDHGDPGALNVTKLITSLSPPKPEEDMPAGTATVYEGNRKWVLFRGTDKALWATVDDAPAFTIGGALASGPSAAVAPSGELVVNVVGVDGKPYEIRNQAGSWGDWHPLPGQAA